MTNGYARMQQQAGAAGGKGGAISCPGMIIRFFYIFLIFSLSLRNISMEQRRLYPIIKLIKVHLAEYCC